MTSVISAQCIRWLLPEGLLISSLGMETSLSLQCGSSFRGKLISSYICLSGSV
jgi:hypothetical protein